MDERRWEIVPNPEPGAEDTAQASAQTERAAPRGGISKFLHKFWTFRRQRGDRGPMLGWQCRGIPNAGIHWVLKLECPAPLSDYSGRRFGCHDRRSAAGKIWDFAKSCDEPCRGRSPRSFGNCRTEGYDN